MSLNDGSPTMTMPVAPTGMMNGGGWGGFGGDNGWWFIILFLAIFCGWGGNGNGFGNRSGGAGVVDGYVLTSDFANIERKLDGVNNGLCDGFYAMNTGMLNGFAGVTQAVTSGFSQAELSRCNQQAALMQMLFQMQMQAQSCCCETREAIQGVNYNMATQACDTRNQVQNSTRDIIDAMNCGFRSIDQRLTAQELAAKDAKIAEQNQQLFAAQLAASQAAQNVPLTETAVNGKPCIVHREGSGQVTLRGLTNQCRAVFKVSYGGNIAIPTGGTVEAITAALAINGEALASATATITPAAVENYFNIYVSAQVSVPKGCCLTVGMRNTSAQTVNFANSNLTVERVA